jgi:hypothetical protein
MTGFDRKAAPEFLAAITGATDFAIVAWNGRARSPRFAYCSKSTVGLVVRSVAEL